MELFNETKNKYILKLISMINRIHSGEVISKGEFRNEFLNVANGNEPKDIGETFLTDIEKSKSSEVEKKTEDDLLKIFDFSDIKQVHIAVDKNIPILLTQAERIWLYQMLIDERARLFLDNDIIELLMKNLNINESLYIKDFVVGYGARNDDFKIDDEYIRKFRNILMAINSHKRIKYCNNAANGEKYENVVGVPFKIEYSTLRNNFMVSMWNEKEARPVKANISSMYNISASKAITDMAFNSIEQMVESRKAIEPINLTVFNKYNAIERSAILFSQYNKKSNRLDDGSMQMEIDYYVFDEHELVDLIMSFGPTIKVNGPENIIEIIKCKISNLHSV